MQDIREEDIAVIGMAGRFPGAKTLSEFWQNLCLGKETIHHFSPEELLSAGVDAALLKQPNYVSAKGIVSDLEYFDHKFFGLSFFDAKILDPQHRLFLMCAWEALENAAYVPKDKNRVGVFASSSLSLYLLKNILSNQELLQNVDEYQLLLGNDKDFLATRVSYLLNLQGPSVNIQTGCSSSLVGVHYACQSLLSGECDLALAGGVSLTVPQTQGYLYKKEMIGSPDGHCYAFDARAQGTVKSNGVGVILLKPLANALKDEDHIYAVIRGTAINNDGANKVGFTAPGVTQQAAVINEALQMADMDPEWVDYIETHGTGTILGDPIEIAALKQVFSGRRNGDKCAVASLKTNLGHLDVAAGIAGLIKACLAVYHGKIPASLNFSTLNPKINFSNSPFYVNTALRDWHPKQRPRVAGVSSFGIGGTNAHIVLQQCLTVRKTSCLSPKTVQLLYFSARSQYSLMENMNAVSTHLKQYPDLALRDVAFTLEKGRELMPYRFAVAISDQNELQSQINSLTGKHLSAVKTSPPVVFMFSGQGSQYPGMARQLYAMEPHFRDALDECLCALGQFMQGDLRQILLAEGADANQLKQTEITQPALFAIEYALAKTYLAFGVKPVALIGHSVGEYAAAVLAEIFTLKDAARLIVGRGRLVQSLPEGSMLALFATVGKVEQILPCELDIALINAPNLTVVSGKRAAIEAFAIRLKEEGIRNQILHTSHAFHSRMMDKILAEFASLVAELKRSPPKLPIASNVSGDWMTVDEALSVDYWVKQLRQTVNFSQGLATVEKRYSPVFIEIGPGRTLQNLSLNQGITKAFNSLPQNYEEKHDQQVFLNTLAQLWNLGVNLTSVTSGQSIPLPSYQWQLERCWIDPVLNTQVSPISLNEAEEEVDPKTVVKEAWKSVLGLEDVLEHDHFFSLGGSSLAAIQLINQMPLTLQKHLNVVHVYQYPRFSDFIQYIQTLGSEDKPSRDNNDDRQAELSLFTSQKEL
ncbi:MAG: acyltransferase domain-containing protein [Tatlockia sp.]|nr:acyltransferase domain-containing protein [Tatlockia sp.]